MPEGVSAAGDVRAAVEVEDCATRRGGARTTPDAAYVADRSGLVRDARCVGRLFHHGIKQPTVDATLPGGRCGPNLIHAFEICSVDGMNDVC